MPGINIESALNSNARARLNLSVIQPKNGPSAKNKILIIRLLTDKTVALTVELARLLILSFITGCAVPLTK
jgi:hypothetical protein